MNKEMNFFTPNPAVPLPGESNVEDRLRDDADLITLFFAGHDGSFAVLLDRHMPMVYGFVYRYLGNADDAADIAQEAFIRAWKHLDRFDRSRSFKTWILAIARNAALDFIKRKKPVLFSQIEAADADIDAVLAPHIMSDELPHEAFDRRTTAQILESAVEKLSAPYRVVLGLRYTEHLKFREIAEILGEPIDTVKSKHRRGVQQLKKLLPEALQ